MSLGSLPEAEIQGLPLANSKVSTGAVSESAESNKSQNEIANASSSKTENSQSQRETTKTSSAEAENSQSQNDTKYAPRSEAGNSQNRKDNVSQEKQKTTNDKTKVEVKKPRPKVISNAKPKAAEAECSSDERASPLRKRTAKGKPKLIHEGSKLEILPAKRQRMLDINEVSRLKEDASASAEKQYAAKANEKRPRAISGQSDIENNSGSDMFESCDEAELAQVCEPSRKRFNIISRVDFMQHTGVSAGFASVEFNNK